MKTKQRIDYLKNFGFADEVTVMAPGINGKMNEFQAALGLVQLQHIDQVIERRKAIDRRYRERLASVHQISCMAEPMDTVRNYAYFPIRVSDEYWLSRDELYQRLRANNIFARRYFYPLISAFPMYRGLASSSRVNLPIANQISEEILCLPLFPHLTDSQVDRIADLICSR